VKPLQSRLRHEAAASIVILPEFASKTTSSAEVGATVSATPPDVVLHVESLDQLPPVARAYFVIITIRHY